MRRCSQANQANQANQSRYLARKSWRVELNYVVLLSLRNLPDGHIALIQRTKSLEVLLRLILITS